MAIYIIRTAFNEGVGSVPYLWQVIKALPWLFLLWAVKFFFSGVSNKSERNMHGKVVMVTVGRYRGYRAEHWLRKFRAVQVV